MTLFETVTAAVAELSETGYDSVERVAYWTQRIREAARAQMMPVHELELLLRRTLTGVYEREIDGGGILRRHPGVSRFTVERLRPALRAELARKLAASTALIRLNQEQMVAKTEQRWVGWATSVPLGGSDVVDKRETKQAMTRALASLPFEERRVAIDQGHKFAESLSETVALGGNAIAGIWHSHFRQRGYNFRPDHKARDGIFYAVRGNWALERGLMSVPDGYIDEITRPAEEPFCRCKYQWVYNLRALPADMLTDRGRDELAEARRKIAAG